ncbi:MAG: ribosome small subunit-dependent GTPase A, partial [Clostridia bacterium]
DDGTKIADTCGFNMLEMPLFDPNKLASYYIDFDEYAQHCKYKGCCHYLEKECGVKNAVAEGLISQERYDRYLKLFKDIKTKWDKRY